MKKKICLFLLAFCLLLTACGPAAQPEPEPAPEVSAPEDAPAPEEPAAPQEPPEPERSQREQDWVEDIEFLREEIKTKHMDPFYFCPEEEFDRKLDQLAARVGELSDSDIFFEMSAIVYALGDSHTVVWWTDPFPIFDRYFPIHFYPFDGKLYVTACIEDYEQFKPYLLREIVGVNGVNILYLQDKAASLTVPHDWHSREEFLVYPAFFDWAGCDYKEGYTFQILNENQEVESVEVPVINGEEWSGSHWVQHEGWEDILYVHSGHQTAYVEGKDGGCIQWCIPEMMYPSLIQWHLGEVRQLAEEHPDCNKLVFDIRTCPGGLGNTQLILDEFRKESDLLEGKQIYVLTGGTTASAATRLMAFFKDQYGAVVAGEPTGQFSSFFGRSDERSLKMSWSVLPHSKIELRISDIWRDSAVVLPEMGVTPVYEEYYDENGKLYEWETTLLPDVFVHQDIEYLRQGKDRVIEWVLAQ